MKINVYDIKRAIEKGDLEVLFKDNKIFLNDSKSGDCVKILDFKQKTESSGLSWMHNGYTTNTQQIHKKNTQAIHNKDYYS